MRFDFPSYIGLLKNSLIENAGQYKCVYFMLTPLSNMTKSDISDPKVSRWVNGVCAIDEIIRAKAGTTEGISATRLHFENEVLKDINSNLEEKLLLDIKELLVNDEYVPDKKKSNLIQLYDNEEYAHFLADCFLYVVSAQTKEMLSLPFPVCDTAINTIVQSSEAEEEIGTGNTIKFEENVILNLPLNEARLISSDNYDLTISAKDDQHAFEVYAEVKADRIPADIHTFEEYMNELQFRGTSDQISISRIRVFDSNKELLIDESDPLYVGRSMMVPPIKIKQYSKYLKGIIESKIYIVPPVNCIELEICDESGEIIRDNRSYRITRARDNDTCIANFTDGEDENISLEFVFTGPRSIDKSAPLHVSLNTKVKRPNDSRCNLTYYRLIQKLNESGKIILWEKKDGRRKHFMEFRGFHDPKLEETKDYNKMIDIFQKILYVEQHLGVSFCVDDFSDNSVLRILQLYMLFTEGIVPLGPHNFVLMDESYDSFIETFPESSSEVAQFYADVNEIEIFDKRIKLDSCYKFAIWANEVLYTEGQKKLIVIAKKVAIFNSEDERVDGTQILGRLYDTLISRPYERFV